MKTLILKETQASYTLAIDEATLAEGPVRVLRGEHIIGVLVAPDEYELFRAWQQERGAAQAYQYLVARPHSWRRQLCLKGRNITVGQLISTIQANHLTPEQAADDLELPVEQVKEALAYYESHRDLIETEAREETARLAAKGYTA